MLLAIVSLNFTTSSHAQANANYDAETTTVAQIVVYNLNMENAKQARVRWHKCERQLNPLLDRVIILQARQKKLTAYEDAHIGEGILPEDAKIQIKVDAMMKRGRSILDKYTQARTDEATFISNCKYLYDKLENNPYSSHHMYGNPSYYDIVFPSITRPALRRYQPEYLPSTLFFKK